jgi:hypothetical protein
MQQKVETACRNEALLSLRAESKVAWNLHSVRFHSYKKQMLMIPLIEIHCIRTFWAQSCHKLSFEGNDKMSKKEKG